MGRIAGGGSEYVARRLAKLEAEVLAGKRSAQSLVAVPRELAARATVTFPDNAFGEPVLGGSSACRRPLSELLAKMPNVGEDEDFERSRD